MKLTRHSRAVAADMPRPRPIHLLVMCSIAAWIGDGHAQMSSTDRPAAAPVGSVRFDAGFLANRVGKGFDIARFEQRNVTPPGVYSVDLWIGAAPAGRHRVTFRTVPGFADAQPCFSGEQLKRIGIDFRKLPSDIVELLAAPDACMRVDQAIPEASATFDFTRQTLTLGIPQASLERQARGYVDPGQWSAGVPIGMLGYNLNVYTSKHGAVARTHGYLGLNGGLNVGNWHLRHDGSYSWSSQGERRYQNLSTYVQRDLPALSSQLVIGETYTSGELFDSTQFRGVRLATDDRMLPDSLRGYAPVVRGIANSNATVRVRQNGTTIYETTVAPGNFEIDDLYPTGYGGDLDVSVTEADGSVHTFSVPYAAVPLSLRPGIHRYSFVAGTVRDARDARHPLFAQATYQRGLTDTITAYGGATLAAGYLSAMLGGVLNTPVGAIGADVTHATTTIPGAGRRSGSSVRVSYAKSFVPTGTDISLAAYRYSTGGYFGLNDAMQVRDAARDGRPTDSIRRHRHRASLTLAQRLGEKGGRLNATASVASYWNSPGSDLQYSVAYSNSYRNVSYSLSATRQRGTRGDANTLYYASVTVPFGKMRPATLSTNVARDSQGRTRMQSTLSGTHGADNALSYGVNVDHAAGNGPAATGGGANITYRSRAAEFSASVGAGSDYRQGSIGMRGAMVAHGGGLTFSQPLSETFAIVEAPGAAGARVTNASGVRIDRRGYAIVPHLTPYSLNTITIDPKGTSMDVDMKETSRQIAPRAGAVPLVRFATETGRAALIRARLDDGRPLPFGAAVHDEAGREVGVVGQASKILARGLAEAGTLTVRWGDDGTACRIAYALSVRERGAASARIRQIDGVCAAVPTTASQGS
ncbi:fimbria/pilus outer membrane usher protein [Burkholderia anthina]|uniref:Fimbrial biogenesis outer membrane usher protein n=2 Tax=Burkholderia anthina TaxID=179879 RepID=A0ABS2BBE4_9BURK|nr:fimbrial biogenesis outer membrane usher protein [Burkholderia anthina]